MPDPRRPKRLKGFTAKVLTGCGNLYVTVNGDPPMEAFAVLGFAGGCEGAQLEATARLISLTLKKGISIDEVIRQLQGIQCPRPVLLPKGSRVLSCADAIAGVLEGRLGVDEEREAHISCLRANTPGGGEVHHL